MLQLDEAGEYSERYGKTLAGEFLLGQALTSVEQSKKILKRVEGDLSRRTFSMLQDWTIHPAK